MNLTPDQVRRYFASRLPGLRQQGKEWRGPCPVHKGERDSFAVNAETGLAYCHSECGRGWNVAELEAAIEGIGVAEACKRVQQLLDLPAPSINGNGHHHQPALGKLKRSEQRSTNRREVCRYRYDDEQGNWLFSVIRYDPKDFGACRPGPNGTVIYDAKGVRRVLYRLSEVAKADRVIVVEGEKDAGTIRDELGAVEEAGFVATTNPFGALKWRDEYSDSLAGKHVVVIPDQSDPDGKGLRHAQQVYESCKKKASSVQIVHLPFGHDTADFKAKGGTAEQLLALLRHEEPDVPAGYELREDGVYNILKSPAEWLCKRIEIIARTHDDHKRSWGKLLRFRDHNGELREVRMPDRLIGASRGDWEELLYDNGLEIGDGRGVSSALRNYIKRARPSATYTITDKVGWTSDRRYNTPAWQVPAGSSRTLFDSAEESLIAVCGTHSDWVRMVAAYCLGNPALIFAVCTAFAPVLLPWRPNLGGGFHFFGTGSHGKSTALRMAGSVWGGGGYDGFLRSWNMTASGAEGVAAMHNNCLLALDELKELSPAAAGNLAYMLANGHAKARARRDGSARLAQKWQLVFLSSGEMSFTGYIREAEGRVFAGQEVRVVDIPVFGRYGLFDELHGLTGEEFAKVISKHATSVYGAAGRLYVERIHANQSSLRARLEHWGGQFSRARRRLNNAANQVLRTAERFSLVAEAGELAIEHEVLPWPPGTAVAAAAHCFEHWLTCRGFEGSIDLEGALEYFREQILAHEPTRFERHRDGARLDQRPVINRLGYLNEARAELQFVSKEFPQELRGRFDHRTLLKALKDIGAVANDGEINRDRCKRRLPDIDGEPRCLVVLKDKLFAHLTQ